MRTGQIVAGALFDFANYYALDEDKAGMLADLREWAADRGLDLDQADVAGWNKSMQQPAITPMECRLTDADVQRIATAVVRNLHDLMLNGMALPGRSS